MKNLKFAVLSIALLFASTAFADITKVVIKTNAQCDMCKKNIETAVNQMDGVKKSLLNVETKELTVKFDDDKVSEEDIVKQVNAIGYWANGSLPNKEAYDKLDDCCKPKAKSCCAAGAKKECSKDGVKKECSKDGAAKKECTKDGTVKKECTKDGTAKKECSKGHTH